MKTNRTIALSVSCLLSFFTSLPCQQQSPIFSPLVSEITYSLFSALSKFHTAIFCTASVLPIMHGIRVFKQRNLKLQYDFWTLQELKKLDCKCMVLPEPEGPEIKVDINKWIKIIEASAHDAQLDSASLDEIQFQITSDIPSLAASLNCYIKLHPHFFTHPEDEQQFILSHEFIHLTECHVTLKALAMMSIPFIQYTAWRAIEAYCAQHLSEGTMMPFRIAQSILLRNGITQGFLTYYCIKQLSNYLEKRADLGACSDAQQCLAAILHLRHKKESTFSHFSLTLEHCYKSHPSHKERVLYLTEKYNSYKIAEDTLKSGI